MDRLDAYLEQHAALPFDWRAHNCAHFAGGWVALVRGIDPLQSWHALMGDIRSAMRRLQAEGGSGAATDAVLGPRLPGAYAARGDVVSLGTGVLGGRRHRMHQYFGRAWGICTGNRIAALGTTGLVLLPTSEARAAWRV